MRLIQIWYIAYFIYYIFLNYKVITLYPGYYSIIW